MLYEYIKDGITQAIRSVLVKKKSGDIRLCIDFRRLNKIMAKDKYPIPLIDNLLDKLVGKSVFTKLDLKKGYFHVFVNEDLVKYTSFTTPLGQFEFLRIPMGLKTSPQVFQRFVHDIFSDMIRQDKVVVYMDDILVASRNIEDHFEILAEVFKRLVENKLELRTVKCKFL